MALTKKTVHPESKDMSIEDNRSPLCKRQEHLFWEILGDDDILSCIISKIQEPEVALKAAEVCHSWCAAVLQSSAWQEYSYRKLAPHVAARCPGEGSDSWRLFYRKHMTRLRGWSQLPPLRDLGKVSCLVMSHDNSMLFTACNNAIHLWDSQGQRVGQMESGEYGEQILSMQVSHDDERLYTTGFDECVCVWSVAQGQLLSVLHDTMFGVIDRLELSSDGCKLATLIPGGCQVLEWDCSVPDTPVCVCDWQPPHQHWLSLQGHNLQMSASGSHLYLLTWHNSNLCVLDAQSEDAMLLCYRSDPSPLQCNQPSEGQCLAISHDEHYVYIGCKNGSIVVFNLSTGQREQVLCGHEGRVSALAVASDDRRLFSAGEDGRVNCWHLQHPAVPAEEEEEEKECTLLLRCAEAPNCMRLNSDDHLLFVAVREEVHITPV